MMVHLKLSALQDVHWHEFAIRFVLGGAMTVIAGAVASHFGAATGGLFLAFPAIFPASVTLVEKHVRQRKEEKGLRGQRRGEEAAALDARGAALGGLGMIGFAAAIYMLIEHSALLALGVATALWAVISLLAWSWRRGFERRWL
jgi:membrane protein implicated in regulation of membrane protease activity